MSIESNPANASSRAQVEARVPAVYSISDLPGEGVKPAAAAAIEEEAEVLHASIKAGSVAQIVVAVIAVVGLIYLLKLVMVTVLAAMLLAFIFEPLVSGLNSLLLPRIARGVVDVVVT